MLFFTIWDLNLVDAFPFALVVFFHLQSLKWIPVAESAQVPDNANGFAICCRGAIYNKTDFKHLFIQIDMYILFVRRYLSQVISSFPQGLHSSTVIENVLGFYFVIVHFVRKYKV